MNIFSGFLKLFLPLLSQTLKFRIMKKILVAGVLLLCAFTKSSDGPWFSGKIIYRNAFATLEGQDITDRLAPVMGNENLYYVSGNNYKAYTEKKQLLELYNGSTNKFQFFMNGQVVPGTDAAVGSTGAVVVKPLAGEAIIAGYACKSLQIEADGNTTLYYFSPKVRVNPELYSKHLMGDWYTYLKATRGALPLKFIVTNRKQGFTMTSVATSVEAMALAADEFSESVPAR